MNDDILKFSGGETGIKGVTLYDENANIQGDYAKFDARIDSTDHAAFYCEKCKREVRIVELEFFKHIIHKHKLKQVHEIQFTLLCESCGRHERKKMYLNSQLGDVNWK